MELQVKILEGGYAPTRAHAGDAGLDLYSPEDVLIYPGTKEFIDAKVAVAIPEGYVGLIMDRSSLAKKGLKIPGGVIDSGYRGSMGVILVNMNSEVMGLSGAPVAIKKGDRIAQLLVVPIAVPTVRLVTSFEGDTTRGEGGFGSTGV